MPETPFTTFTLSKYRAVELLGKGGFGTVYRAIDTTLDREVALKVLHPQLVADPTFVERFRTEAKIIAALRHPDVVGVYELGEEAGRLFIAMEYMPGGTLKERLAQRGRLSFDETLTILQQVCAGLDAAHAKGMIHRDIKPGNILFDAAGNAVIGDFGLARAVQLSSMASQSSSAGGVGTPFYKAPELWRGKPPASPATDVYALACVVYEMLTGYVLFHGDTPDEVLTKHLIDGPDFSENWLSSDIPSGLPGIIQRGIARIPEDRYATAKAFAGALSELTLATQRALEAAALEAKRQVEAAATREAAARAETERLQHESEASAQREAAARAKREAEDRVIAHSQRETVVAPAAIRGGDTNASNTPWRLIFGAAGAIGALIIIVLLAGGNRFAPPATPEVLRVEVTRMVEQPVASTPLVVEVTRVVEQPVVVTPTPKPTVASASPMPTNSPALDIGSTQLSTQDNMPLMYVPAGEFTMGSVQGDPDAQPEHQVYLDAFWIDRFEVTTARYALCVAAGVCRTPVDKTSFDVKDYYGNAKYADYPMINVSWSDAQTYCLWANRRLPTEAEWEKAARGTDGRVYPWGSTYTDADQATYYATDWILTPVDSRPKNASPYGALMMAGNVWEWVADWYSETYYTQSPNRNPTGPTSGERRVNRGGSWNMPASFRRMTFRSSIKLGEPDFEIGFRCTKSTQ